MTIVYMAPSYPVWREPMRYQRYFQPGDEVYCGGLWFKVESVSISSGYNPEYQWVNLSKIDPPATVHYLHAGDLRGSGGRLNIGKGPLVGTIIVEEL